jgi:hypothetical protein
MESDLNETPYFKNLQEKEIEPVYLKNFQDNHQKLEKKF